MTTLSEGDNFKGSKYIVKDDIELNELFIQSGTSDVYITFPDRLKTEEAKLGYIHQLAEDARSP
jgi:hypothetical protein